jgi:TP53 regulating kinase and related kinases
VSTFHGAISEPHPGLLYRGAEADLVRGRWQGLDAVFKVRKPLTYRLQELDDEIRRQRTIREAEMLHLAKEAKVPAPYLYAVDVRGATLVMEYVDGERLRDRAKSSWSAELAGYFHEFGRDAALLHSAGIVHGDLTTANVVVRGGSLVFLDFGLSFRTTRLEDRAVDVRLIKETLTGAHPEISRQALEELLSGYREVVGEGMSRTVARQLRSIERRGRYARVI